MMKDKQTGQILLQANSCQGLYPLSSSSVSSHSHALVASIVSLARWHARLGHPNDEVLSRLCGSTSRGSPKFKSISCESCLLGKSHRLPFESVNHRASFPLVVIHSDVWTSPIVSNSGFKYVVLFVDDYSRFTWIFPMKAKSEVPTHFHTFRRSIENLCGTKIKILQSDGGGEYISTFFQNSLRDNGIIHRLSCPDTPSQNGLAERKIRHLIELSRTLLFHSHLPPSFWVESLLTAVYTINRLPTPTLSHRSPFHCLVGFPFDCKYFRVFGCACYPFLPSRVPHKLAPRSIPCVFLGYASNQKGYRCLDRSSGRVFVSRHVRFDEEHFPFYRNPSDVQQSFPPHTKPSPLIISSHSPILPTTSLEGPSSVGHRENYSSHLPIHIDTSISSPQLNSCPSLSTPSSPSPPDSPDSPNLPLPYSTSHPIPPTTTSNSLISSSSLSSDPDLSLRTHPMQTRSKSGIIKHRQLLNLSHSLHEDTPTCYSKAILDPRWKAAMADEFNALIANRTWILVPPDPSKNLVGCKWVYRVKEKSDGSVERFKARLVAQGFKQQAGLDYDETFSPVVKPTTIRVVLSLAISSGWSIRQLDVKNAFLHGFLQEEVYMRQPPGFTHPEYPDHVCRLRKAIYGLKQAPRAWFHRFSSFLLSLGFMASKADPSLFTFGSPHGRLYLLLYVDDIIVTSDQPPLLQSLLNRLSKEFAMKDLGPLHYFLGIEAHHKPTGVLLSQAKYINGLLHKFDLAKVKSVSTPLASKAFISAHEGELLSSPTLYRQMVGALQYVSMTRPDISFAVSLVSQYMHQPRLPHLQAIKRIYRYLAGTSTHGLLIEKCSSPTLTAYADADWAGCSDTRRSTSGFCVFMGSNLVSWSAKKQPTVSRSSTGAEYLSVAYCVAETIWIRHSLLEYTPK